MHDRRQAPPPLDPLGDLLADGRPIVLDGGLATELEAGGADLSNFALVHPAAGGGSGRHRPRAHLAFYRAGAEVATTAKLPGLR